MGNIIYIITNETSDDTLKIFEKGPEIHPITVKLRKGSTTLISGCDASAEQSYIN